MEAGASGPTRRVVVAEASLPVRQELCGLLGLIDGVEVVGRAVDSAEAVRLASALSPDVVVLDYQMSHGDGSDAAASIRDQLPGCLLVALTIHELGDEREVARRSGFSSFLAMDAPPSALLEVIHGMLAQAVLSPDPLSGHSRPRANT